jgi:hypothetical protein
MLNISKDRIVNFVLILFVIYIGSILFNKIYDINEEKIIEKTLLLTILITLSQHIYPIV